MNYAGYLIPCIVLISPAVAWGQNIGLGTTVPQTSVHMHDPNSDYTKVMISSVAINDSASLFLTEDLDGIFGVGWLYDGISNYLRLYGHSNLGLIGPHISAQRDNPTRVGIGVSSPQETLHVGGGLRLGNSSTMAAGTLRWTGSDFEGYDGSAWESFTQGSKWSEQNGTPNNIYYTLGNVGIGTASPTRPVDIQTATPLSVIDVSNLYTGVQAQTGVKVDLSNSGSGNKIGFYTQVSNNAAFNNNALYGTYAYIPAASSGTHYGVYAEVDGSDNFAIYGDNPSPSGYAGYFTGRGHFGSTLTIGSEEVLGELHVHSALEHAQIFISPAAATSGDTASIFLAEDDDGTFGMYWMYDGFDNEMQLFSKESLTTIGPHLRIDRSTGEMALGNVFATDHRLSVDGKIACEEVRVELSGAWPDYVFDEGYERMPLHDLARFVRQNNHLPGIPTAEEIASDGLELGQMQRQMMEKIEELTLYLIDLNTVVSELRRENEALRRHVNQLSANHQ
ncbi:MAG: hypothetical protein R3301_08330 [Saprospiraceae bacterium]|nr:hypothetical protein [Saprospiraceae bacterium]